MASRRMFSIRLINSARFLKMPISSQALYFHLGLHADDDGIVEAYTVIKNVGCSEDDLRVLVSKGFIQILNEDLVSYITDWNENNFIRADRKIDSIYQNLLISINPDVKLLEKKERVDKKNKVVDNQGTTKGQPMDCIGKDSIDKYRLDKNSIDKNSIGECYTADESAPALGKESKHAHGEYKHVRLKDSELAKLIDDLGKDMTDSCITYLDEYIEMKGYKAKNHYLCIRKWVIDAVNEKRRKSSSTGNRVADQLEQSYQMMSDWAQEGQT